MRAIEKRPKLLFLIRLAPYPYNVMNCLLAASPTLTLRTYTLCTSLSLFKLIIHTSIGSSIRSFAEYHVVKPGESTPARADESLLSYYSTIAGVLLCVAIFWLFDLRGRWFGDALVTDRAQTTERLLPEMRPLQRVDNSVNFQEVVCLIMSALRSGAVSG